MPPKHDWASHAAGAFTYLAMEWKQKMKSEPLPERPLFKPLSEMSYRDYDEEIVMTYNGTRIITEPRHRRDRDRP